MSLRVVLLHYITNCYVVLNFMVVERQVGLRKTIELAEELFIIMSQRFMIFEMLFDQTKRSLKTFFSWSVILTIKVHHALVKFITIFLNKHSKLSFRLLFSFFHSVDNTAIVMKMLFTTLSQTLQYFVIKCYFDVMLNFKHAFKIV